MTRSTWPTSNCSSAAAAISSHSATSHGAGGVRHVDVADAALLGVLLVALERADVADGGHLPEELHVVHAGLDVGDRVGLLVAQLVGDEHGRGLLVGESAHLIHLVLDGRLELLELDIGVEILVDVLYHSHTRTTSVVESADKRCLCRGLAAESDRLFCGFRGVAVAGRGFVIPVHQSRRYKRCAIRIGADESPRSVVSAPCSPPLGTPVR
jgi:hypothetical protein